MKATALVMTAGLALFGGGPAIGKSIVSPEGLSFAAGPAVTQLAQSEAVQPQGGQSINGEPGKSPANAVQAPGMLTTRAFKKVSDSATVTVTPYDDNDLNLQLKADFESALAAQERTVTEAKTGLLLLFETKVIPAEQAPRRPSLGSVRASSGNERDLTRESEDSVEVEANVNVWSNTQDSVLGGRQEAQALGASVFHMNAVLRDQSNGEVLWQGDAYYELQTPDTERIARSMVPLLVDNLGKSAANEPFEAQ
ncbi:hypothetical protein HBA54_12980 [Pelagibius litoralis]|uniref:Uncharacterized protein n=1 Tax=Pelagibius litoralis TaxID=374515 RepID=A0A967K6X7_9PROT|nr:hypothetical protein [Pelagibius litoralis]NIA69508.1 hypothetical protein [Pelagibius litoralis]